MPFVVLLVAVLAACGGDEGSAATTTPNVATAATEPTEPDSPEQTTTTATESSTETTAGDDGLRLSGETSAILELGGDIYRFGTSDRTTCDTERLGLFYEAQLDHIDDSGESIGSEGILIVLPLADEGDRTVSVAVDGASWTAGEGTGGGFEGDTHIVDGQRAEATLTFVNAAGDEIEGSFEVFCAEG